MLGSKVQLAPPTENGCRKHNGRNRVYEEFSGNGHLFGFDFKYRFRAYSVQKVKFDTEANSNMQSSLVVFIASVLHWK